MRGKVLSPIKREMWQYKNSYVQINIYNMSVKGLRDRGVDIKHMLQHIGCRSVVLDVPVPTPALQNPSTRVRRLKTFAGFDAKNASIKSKGSELDETSSILEASMDDVDNSVGNKERPLTSTPYPGSENARFGSFLNGNLDIPTRCGNPSDALAETIDASLRNDSFRISPSLHILPMDSEEIKPAGSPSTVPITSAGALSFTPSSKIGSLSLGDQIGIRSQSSTDLEKPQCVDVNVAENSFHLFSREVVQGLQSVNEDRVTRSNVAMVDNTVHFNESSCSKNYVETVGMDRSKIFEYSCFEGNGEAGSSHNTSDIENKMLCDVGDFENHNTAAHFTVGTSKISHESSLKLPRSMRENSMTNVSQPDGNCDAKKLMPLSLSDDEEGPSKGKGSLEIDHAVMKKEEADSDDPIFLSPEGNSPIRCHMPNCPAKLLWRVRYGKGHLLDHVRLHWAKAVKHCRICGFKAFTFRRINHHHKLKHSSVPYIGALSTETKEDMEELLRYWKMCFPGLPARGVMKWIPLSSEISCLE